MRMSDWSSDVCSSYLHAHHRRRGDLNDGPRHRDLADRKEIAQRKVKADAEHQQDDAKLGQFQRQFAVGDKAGGERADGNTSGSEEHTSELQSLMRISYAVFCLKKTKQPSRDMKENEPIKH